MYTVTHFIRGLNCQNEFLVKVEFEKALGLQLYICYPWLCFRGTCKKKMKNKEIITDGEEIQKVYGSKENQKSKSQ